MQKHFSCILAMVLLCCTSIAQEKADSIQASIIAFFDGLSRVDAKTLEAHTSKGFILLEDGEVWNLDTLIRKMGPGNNRTVKRVNSFQFIKTEQHGSTATVSYFNTAQFSRGDQHKTVRWLESAELVKEKGNWKINLLHSTKLEEPGLPAYYPESRQLYDTIARMDSLFFDAYNTCKLDIMDSLISEDLEFYHDRVGLSTSKKDMLSATRTNICGKVTRELLKGSLEIYPIAGYGAVQLGAHRFRNNQEKDQGPSRYARFVHTWHRENGKWKLSRVISLH